MTLLQYAQFSSAALMSAAIVYSLALLAHIAEWASMRSVALPRADAVLAMSPPVLGSRQRADESAGSNTPDVRRTQLFGRIGVSLTILGFGLNVAAMVARGLAAERVPWGNMYEFTIAACVGTVGMYLFFLSRSPIRWLGLPVVAVTLTMLMLAILLLELPAGPLVPALRSYWLYIHVTAAILATGAFTVGAVTSALYLARNRAEMNRLPVSGWTTRLPSAEVMDQFAYRAHAFGFPLWTFAALIAGPIWARYAWGRYWGWDPKEVWAFITWVAYAAYLHARATGGWRGKGAAILALIGFATLVFNFVGINLFGSGLHSYSGR